MVFDEPGTPNTVALMLGCAATSFRVRIPRPAVIRLARSAGSSGARSFRSTSAPPHWAPPVRPLRPKWLTAFTTRMITARTNTTVSP